MSRPRPVQVVLLAVLLFAGAGLWAHNAHVWEQRARHDVRATHGEHEVTVFVTAWCPYCRRLRAWFDASGVPYRALDVETDAAAAWAQEAVAGRFAGVPTVVVGQDVYQGYATDKLAARLARAGHRMTAPP